MSNLGRRAVLIAIIMAAIMLIFAFVAIRQHEMAMMLANLNSTNPAIQAMYQVQATQHAFTATWNFISTGMVFVLIIMYIKTFSTRCAEKDWNAIMIEKIGTRFPKAWLMVILLATFSYGIGAIGVAIPAIWIWFFGPGKGKKPGTKKLEP